MHFTYFWKVLHNHCQVDNMNLINLNNTLFWKTVKPFLSDKGSYISKINLVNIDEVISDDSTLAETFSKFFESKNSKY